MAREGRVPRILAGLHEVLLGVVLVLALVLGALPWLALVPALDPRIAFASGPWAGVDHGIGWTWPALAALVVAGAARWRSPLRAFVAMVLRWRNVVPGLLTGLAAVTAARWLTALAVLVALDPGRAASGAVGVLGWSVLLVGEIWLAGFLAGRVLAAGRAVPSPLVLGWALTWRAAGMLAVLSLAGVGALALGALVAALPGLAVAQALIREPGLPLATGLAAAWFRPLSFVAIPLAMAWAMVVVPVAGVLVPGHVAHRVLRGLVGEPEAGADPARRALAAPSELEGDPPPLREVLPVRAPEPPVDPG